MWNISTCNMYEINFSHLVNEFFILSTRTTINKTLGCPGSNMFYNIYSPLTKNFEYFCLTTLKKSAIPKDLNQMTS